MSSYFDDASLVMIPSGYKTSKVYSVKPTDGTGDLAFTRSNDTATRVASNGLIEKVRTNLALRSQEFATSAVWSTASGTITNNAGTAPDGTNTASKIVAINTDPYCYQSLTLSGSVVASCYIKGIGSSIGKTGSIRAAGSITNFTITGDWQRVSVAHTAGGAQNYGVETPEIAVVSDEVLLWGFQVEYGDVATPYIATTTAAVSVGPVANVPRLDYLNSSCPRLLLEPQRQNVVTFSEQINNAAWTKNVSVTANAIASPDGTTNADKLVESASNVEQWAYQLLSLSGAQTISIYAKKAERNFVALATSGLNASYFNLDTGVVVSAAAGATASIVNAGNGWYRCSVTSTTSTGNFAIVWVSDNGTRTSYAGDITKGIYVWGAQQEAGAYATSYIPTLGASVTRGADAASKTGISSLIGQTEGTFFAEFTIPESQSPSFFSISDGSGTNRIIFGYYLGVLRYYTNSATGSFSSAGVIDAAPVVGQTYKIAIAYKANDFKVYKNGSNTNTETTYTVPASLTALDNEGGGAGQNIYAGVKQLLLFKTRLSNADLAALTA